MEWRPQPFGQFGARLGDLRQEEPDRNAQGTSKLFRIERAHKRVLEGRRQLPGQPIDASRVGWWLPEPEAGQ